MYMKANYFSLFAAYWNKQGLLVLPHINTPGEIIYFPLPSRKYLKRGREVFFCTVRKVLSKTVAETQIQQRVSNLKPTLFYSNKCMHKCLLFQPQGSQEWDQLWLYATPSTRAEQAPGFCLALHSPSSSNPGSKHRENSQFTYRAEESRTPKAGEMRSKRNWGLQPMEQKPIQREGGDRQRQWVLMAERIQRDLAPVLGKAPTAEDWTGDMGGVGSTWTICNRQYKDTDQGPWIGWART